MPQKAKTGDYIIKKRRALEEKRDALRADVQERIVIGGIANWEVKTAKRIETNRAVTYFNKMKAEAEERLTERRKRLAAKLSKEQAQYEIEVENSFETAEERAARLATRALQLKAERAARMKKASENLSASNAIIDGLPRTLGKNTNKAAKVAKPKLYRRGCG